jgi:hypothetical protein
MKCYVCVTVHHTRWAKSRYTVYSIYYSIDTVYLLLAHTVYENDERYQLDATIVIYYHKYLYMLPETCRDIYYHKS